MRVYDDVLVPRFFVPWAELLLDGVRPARGEAVLDVACGPGSATRLAAAAVGPDGRVTGCDFSPAMLAIARAKGAVDGGAPIDYVEAPADALPVADAEYDVVLCQQGVQFFPDQDAAAAEMHRALRPGGRVGIAVWCAIETNPMFATIADAIEEVAGEELATRYRGGPWGMPEPQQLEDLLRGAGFADLRVEQARLSVRFEGGPDQMLSTVAASGIAADLAALPPEQQAELAESYRRRAEPLVENGVLVSETASSLAFATRA